MCTIFFGPTIKELNTSMIYSGKSATSNLSSITDISIAALSTRTELREVVLLYIRNADVHHKTFRILHSFPIHLAVDYILHPWQQSSVILQ